MSPQRRELAYQAGLALVLVGGAVAIFFVTQANLERLGVDSGFAFLWQRAGFEIGQKLIPFDANASIAHAFVVAFLNTLVLAVFAIAGASLLGLAIGTARLSPNWLLARLALAYVEVFRNIPSLLQIFFWYFVVLRSLPRPADSHAALDLVFLNNRGLHLPWPGPGDVWPMLLLLAVAVVAGVMAWRRRGGLSSPATVVGGAALLGALALALTANWGVPVPGRFGYENGLVVMPEFMALVVGLSMYNATYISEIVRSGFQSIPRGQKEAADSLGFNGWQQFSLVLLPQALRVMIPPLTTVYLNLFKSTSLAAAIAYPEIVSVFVGTVNNLVGQPVTIMAVTLAVYSLVSLGVAAFLNWYNRRIAL